MIPTSRERRPGVPVTWALPAGIFLGLLLGVFAGVVSGAVLLDIIAWWPVWFVLGALAWRARGRRLGLVRASGLVPLLASIVAVVFLVAHVQGWPLMPSTSGRLIGPDTPFARAALVAEIDGWLRVDDDARFLYEAFPIRWGGDVNLPVAVEQTVEDSISVNLRPQDGSMFQRYRGWDLSLAAGPLWDLTLRGTVEGDLSALELTRLRLGGAGSVRFGVPPRATDIEVSGAYTLLFPSGAAVHVVGEASVPGDWVQQPDGWSTPDQGPGWVVKVSPGSTVTVGVEG
jgi:hypothetical protein